MNAVRTTRVCLRLHFKHWKLLTVSWNLSLQRWGLLRIVQNFSLFYLTRISRSILYFIFSGSFIQFHSACDNQRYTRTQSYSVVNPSISCTIKYKLDHPWTGYPSTHHSFHSHTQQTCSCYGLTTATSTLSQSSQVQPACGLFWFGCSVGCRSSTGEHITVDLPFLWVLVPQ